MEQLTVLFVILLSLAFFVGYLNKSSNEPLNPQLEQYLIVFEWDIDDGLLPVSKHAKDIQEATNWAYENLVKIGSKRVICIIPYTDIP